MRFSLLRRPANGQPGPLARQLALALAGGLLSFGAQAQLASYTFSQSTTATYVPIAGGTVLGTLMSDDQQFNDPATPAGIGTVAPGPGFPIGFTFQLGGVAYDRFAVNNNGWIALGNSSGGATAVSGRMATGSNYTPISNASTTPANVVAGFVRDLNAQPTSELSYSLVGTAPARTLVVQWKSYRRYNAVGDDLNFQVRLNESGNTVALAYGPNTITNATAVTVQVGLRGASNADFNSRTSPTPGTATTWTTTTAAAAAPETVPLSATAVPPADLQFLFTPPATGACLQPTNLAVASSTFTTASISFTASASATGYTATLTPAGGSATPISPNPTTSPINLTGLAQGTTYTLALTSVCAGGATSPAANLTFTTPLPAPTNDECATATALPVGATCTNTTVNTVGATISAGLPATNVCGGASSADVWYTVVVPASGSLTVTTSALAGSSTTDTVLDLYSGSCTALVSAGCNDDIGGGNNFSSVTANGQTAGATLYVRARVFGATGTGTFGICATAAAACAPVTALAATNVSSSGATLGFTAPAGATGFNIILTPQGGTAQTGTLTASPLVLTGLPSGTTYTVSVTNNCGGGTVSAPTTTTFTTTGTTCAAPTAVSVGSITNTSATLTFTAGAANTSYTVTYFPTATPAATQTLTPAPTASPIVIPGLAPATAYTVRIAAVCAAGSNSGTTQGTFTTLAGPPPANDNPTGAIALVVSNICVPVAGTNVNATTTTPVGYPNPPATPCGVASSPRDVWYSFNSGNSTGVRLTVTGNPAGLVRVFSATSNAGPFTQVVCSAGATTNSVAAPANATGLRTNTVYYVSVAGYGSTDITGPFTICATSLMSSNRAALSGGQLALYPNPASASVALGLPGLPAVRSARVEVINALGQVLRTQTVATSPLGNEATLDIAGLATGLYTVRVQAGAETATVRLAVK